jgi:hypothetical protein
LLSIGAGNIDQLVPKIAQYVESIAPWNQEPNKYC